MKKILIMGATSGIGLQLAGQFASKGWMVGAAGRSEEPLRRLASLYPRNIRWRVIDINTTEAPEGLDALVEEMGGMDVYFHVAGIGFDNLPLREREEVAVMETNVVGFTRMSARHSGGSVTATAGGGISPPSRRWRGLTASGAWRPIPPRRAASRSTSGLWSRYAR